MAIDQSFVVTLDTVTRTIDYQDFMTYEFNHDEPNKIVWVHCDLTQEGVLDHAIEQLNLSTDVISVIRKSNKASQILDRENSLTLKLACLFRKNEGHEATVEKNKLVIHLAKRFCLTVARGSTPILEGLLAELPSAVQYARTPCFVLFLIMDSLVTHYASILYDYEVRAEELDLNAKQSLYKDIVLLKKRTINVKRHTMIILNILLYTSGREINAVSKACKVSLSTLLNNSQAVVNQVDSIRELIYSAIGQIDNALMREVNNTMRVLTAIAAIFMPPSLISSIYGMRFDMPELALAHGYLYAWILMLTSMLGMVYYFRRNKWY